MNHCCCCNNPTITCQLLVALFPSHCQRLPKCNLTTLSPTIYSTTSRIDSRNKTTVAENLFADKTTTAVENLFAQVNGERNHSVVPCNYITLWTNRYSRYKSNHFSIFQSYKTSSRIISNDATPVNVTKTKANGRNPSTDETAVPLSNVL